MSDETKDMDRLADELLTHLATVTATDWDQELQRLCIGPVVSCTGGVWTVVR